MGEIVSAMVSGCDGEWMVSWCMVCVVCVCITHSLLRGISWTQNQQDMGMWQSPLLKFDYVGIHNHLWAGL